MKWVYHPIYMKTGTPVEDGKHALVVDGIMYTGTALEAVALDAVTGRVFWKLSAYPGSQGPTTTPTK